MKISIKDTLFSHAFSSSNWFKPKNFEWDFKSINSDYVILTDDFILNHSQFNGLRKFAWLVESPSIKPNSYNFVKNNGSYFEKIFTFDKEILDRYENSYPLYIGGCHLDESEISNSHQKNKLISMMISHKNYTDGHRLRFEIFNQKNYFPNVDFKGDGTGQGWSKKSLTTVDYKFSIVIENCKRDYWFTEKLIDCLRTGTVPIYWGCPSIGDFFDVRGFIIFDNLNELGDILKNLTEEDYNIRLKYIKENFMLSENFILPDDIIYKKITLH